MPLSVIRAMALLCWLVLINRMQLIEINNTGDHIRQHFRYENEAELLSNGRYH